MDDIKKAVEGDENAFAVLYRKHRQEIFTFLVGRIRNREDALDLTSDVFLAAYSGIKNFKMECSFRTWLYAITKHKLNDYFSRKNIQNIQSDILNISEAEINEATLDQTSTLECEVDLQSILNQLLPQEQEILLLHNVNGLSFSECGQLLNISTVYARVFHHRALMKAKDIAKK